MTGQRLRECKWIGCHKVFEPDAEGVFSTTKYCPVHWPMKYDAQQRRYAAARREKMKDPVYKKDYNRSMKALQEKFGYDYHKTYIEQWRRENTRKNNDYMKRYMARRRSGLKSIKKYVRGMRKGPVAPREVKGG